MAVVPEVAPQIVEEFKGAIPIIKILEILSVSKSTYYRWKKDGVPTSDLTELAVLIVNSCKETKYRYGYSKITGLLNRTIKVNTNTVQRIMHQHKCNCRVKRKRHCVHETSFTADNIIDRELNSDKPLEVDCYTFPLSKIYIMVTS